VEPRLGLLVVDAVVIATGFWHALRRGVVTRRPDPPFLAEEALRRAVGGNDRIGVYDRESIRQQGESNHPNAGQKADQSPPW